MNKMIKASLFAVCSFLAILAQGQDSLKTGKDTVTVLNEVVVHAYANDRALIEVPAAKPVQL